MMNYWLTTHWPRYTTDPSADVKPGVWLQKAAKSVGARLASGDVVFVYQAQSGPDGIGTTAAGKEVLKPRRRGRAGVTAVGIALAPFTGLDDEAALERYADGSEKWGRWHAPLQLRSQSGFVPRAEINRALGYKVGFNFHGFGNQHSGLKLLEPSEADRLLEAFLGDRQGLPAPERSRRHLHGETEPESDAHRNLKLFVASDPSRVLGEEGLSTLAVEYQFPTQDRADLVLEDRFGCVIGLEVEVDCGPDHIAGVLQAIKYRRMLEVMLKRHLGDGRAMLVAYSLSPEVRELCARYDVEAVAVSRETVPNVARA
jgi:hypothetical protein